MSMFRWLCWLGLHKKETRRSETPKGKDAQGNIVTYIVEEVHCLRCKKLLKQGCGINVKFSPPVVLEPGEHMEIKMPIPVCIKRGDGD